MFRLRIGYLVGGITTGLILLLGFFWSLPDGKLHLAFCDVGQGDAAYVRFPDGRDMLVDGGPNNKVLECLGRHMPFWDRHINLVVLTHPQKDHMQGLIAVLDRYGTDYFVRSDIANSTEGYQQLMGVIERRGVKQKFVTTGETIAVGSTTLSVLWPSGDQIAVMKSSFARHRLAKLITPASRDPPPLLPPQILLWQREEVDYSLLTGYFTHSMRKIDTESPDYGDGLSERARKALKTKGIIPGAEGFF